METARCGEGIGRRYLTVLLITLVVCAGWLVSGCESGEGPGSMAGEFPIQRQVKLALTLTNPTGRELGVAELRVYGVVRQTSTQLLLGESATGPSKKISDNFGNQVWVYRFSDLAPTAAPKVGFQLQLGFADRPVELTLDSLEQYRQTSGNAEIQDIADQLSRESEQSEIERLLAWFGEWRAQKPEVSPTPAESPENLYVPITEVLQGRQPSVVAEAHLLVYVARAMSIPARVVIGIQTADDAALTLRDVTAWPELYVDNTWKAIDLEKAVLAGNSSQYLAMRVLGGESESIQLNADRYLIETVGIYAAPGAAKITFKNRS